MIGKHNFHSDANQCCKYIPTQKDNDSVRLVGVQNSPVQDPYETAVLMEARKRGTRADYAVYHVQIAPDQNAGPSMTEEQKLRAIQIYTEKFNWQNRTMIWSEHMKGGHPHLHGMVSRWNPDTGRMDPSKKWARDSREASMEMEQEFGHKPTRLENKAHVTIAQIMNEAWYSTKTGTQFRQAIAAQGFALCHGKGKFHVVDSTGIAYPLLDKIQGIRRDDLKERFGNPFGYPKMADTTKSQKAAHEAAKAMTDYRENNEELERKKLREQMRAARQRGRGR